VLCRVGVIALHEAGAGPSRCRRGGCEGKAMPELVLPRLQFVCKAMLAALFACCVRSGTLTVGL
jgi:hypothetical protein